MSGTQFGAYALATAPTALAVLIGILINNSRLSDLPAHVDTRFDDINRRFDEMDRKMDHRFEDMKSTWRSELHRVEEVLDAA